LAAGLRIQRRVAMAVGILVLMKAPRTAFCILDGLRRASDVFLIAQAPVLSQSLNSAAGLQGRPYVFRRR
jgi:hypothetical protein